MTVSVIKKHFHFRPQVAAQVEVARFVAVVVFGWLTSWQAAAAGPYSYITNFTKTGNNQTNLQSSFPVGVFVASNAFATPFNITSDDPQRLSPSAKRDSRLNELEHHHERHQRGEWYQPGGCGGHRDQLLFPPDLSIVRFAGGSGLV